MDDASSAPEKSLKSLEKRHGKAFVLKEVRLGARKEPEETRGPNEPRPVSGFDQDARSRLRLCLFDTMR
ncbi:hypothetical protein A7C99_6252 [Trichophyton rubrum]|uniref:Uncharacterized protein n=1 Tax=Trichophyton rubrum TaxID=5551 RepID=A0A178EPS2_TRIRU|nr:hypothetical protein A7C99_6252 [Trichophyton rubrum]